MSQRDRRLEVSEAAWRVIVREGLDRTSMRAIAQELGCTTGVVTHYFRDKQELILFALNQVTQSLLKAMQAQRAQELGVERLLNMVSAFLPQDVERQAVLKVWLAFLGYAVGRDSLMAEHQQSAAQLREVIMQELQALQSVKLIRDDVDLELEANALLALANGVSLDFLIQAKHLSPEQQQQVIRRYVDELLSIHTSYL
ncbi:MAG: TetR/AcrR family transcriptional regulator [Aphanothece sp. CMT-3BRIN-NPC111]|jgi:AcrR family transcriptional regulator|nr:TetR/AcrR family transcriptional regulator [Aphanothece sp. CMT-3BRIN-NPC111]